MEDATLVIAIAVLASLMPIVIAIWSRCLTCVWLSTIALLANLGLILATPQIIYFVAEVGASIGHNVVKGLVEETQLRFPWHYPQEVR